MSSFPVREDDVINLAEQIIAGATAHPGDFPSLTPALITQLTGELDGFREARTDQESTKGQLKIATVTKEDGFDNLVTMMKNFLKKAEVDCTTLPENLAEIGWGTRNAPTPIQSPTAPTNLHPVAEGVGEIWMNWDKPANDSNRPVRNFVIERHDQQQAGFGPWNLVATSYDTEIHLVGQPTEVRVEFRVKAANAAGESMPSNTVSVVLP